jgi:hypothetical protein
MIDDVDDKLSEIAFKVDDILTALIEEYKIDTLSLTSIITARLVLINDFTGNGERYRALLASVPQMDLKRGANRDTIVH